MNMKSVEDEIEEEMSSGEEEFFDWLNLKHSSMFYINFNLLKISLKPCE